MTDAILRDAHGLAIASAREDFDAFAEYVGVDDVGEPIVQAPLHRFMWRFVDWAHERGLYAGVMIPVGHGKTTQAVLRAAWEIGRDENVLCRVVAASEEDAGDRARAIRAVMAHPAYRRVFPGVRIVRGEQSETEFTVKRSGVSKDPTLGCSGVLTGTGARATCLILDDIVNNKNAVQNPAERARVLRSFRGVWMSRPSIIGSRKPLVVWIQTAYHVEDAAAVTMREGAGWAWLVVRSEHPFAALSWEIRVGGEVETSGSLPNVVDREQLERLALRLGSPIEVARGLGNRHVAEGEQPFSEELFAGPRPLPAAAYVRRVAYFDPAGDPTRARKGDPDWAALAVVGKHPKEPVWDVVFSGRLRAAPQRQAEWCAERCRELGVTSLNVEAVADGAMPVLVGEALRKIDCSIPVHRIQPGKRKEIRVQEALEPRLRQGLLRVHGALFRELVAEALVFPLGAHDDLVDSLAGAMDAAESLGPARHRSSVKKDRERRRIRPPRVWQKRGRVWAD
ncbi:MAG TPA: hypothetical protein VFY93_02770 [Planctomycetota bacterium]|nr:hypothetical protein [Planctomycetota bacterium]